MLTMNNKEIQERIIPIFFFFYAHKGDLSIFNEWHKHGKIEVYKSDRHHDGNIPFLDDKNNWFIVVAILPDGKQSFVFGCVLLYQR